MRRMVLLLFPDKISTFYSHTDYSSCQNISKLMLFSQILITYTLLPWALDQQGLVESWTRSVEYSPVSQHYVKRIKACLPTPLKILLSWNETNCNNKTLWFVHFTTSLHTSIEVGHVRVLQHNSHKCLQISHLCSYSCTDWFSGCLGTVTQS